MENRTLEISNSITGFEYRYEICKKHILGICVKHDWQVETYDISDPVIKKQLKDAGFVLKVRKQL